MNVIVGNVSPSSYETVPPVLGGVFRSDGINPLDGLHLASSTNEVLILVKATDNIGVGLITVEEGGDIFASRKAHSNKLGATTKLYVGEVPISPGIHTWTICVLDFSFNRDCQDVTVTK